jgi:PAS domain S-box-containing protein
MAMIADTKTRILLVDDQPANLAVLEVVLAELGQELVSVTSGEHALRELLEHEFAVVLLDVQMPAMCGFDTARLIREHPRSHSVPIIFLTAGDDASFPVEEAYALGAVDYLTKPFNQTVLRAKVAVFIDLYRKNAELTRLERLRHLADLRSRDERIRLILDNVRDYAFIGTDVDRRVTEWEGGAAAIAGWSAQDAIGQSVDILFTPEDRAAGQPEAEAQRALESGRSEDRRWHVRRDGSRFFADGVMVALRDEGGGLRGFAKILRDATAERLAAERLEQSEKQLGESLERFSLLLESAGEGIFGLGPDGVCTFMNAAAASMLGYQPDELVGRRVHDRIHHHHEDGKPYPAEQSSILHAVRGGEVLRADGDVFWRKDGSMVPVAYSVYPMVIGGRTAGAVLTFTDVTERRQAEAEREGLYREVRAANERMIDIFYRAPAFMCVMRGAQHVFEMVNERYLELTGARELIGHPVREALPEVEGQGLFELLDEVYRSGEAYEGSNVRMLLQPGGARQGLEEHFVDFVFMALRDPDGSIAGVLVHGVDVTERTRASLLAVGQRSALELAVSHAPLEDVLDVLARTAEEYSGATALAAVQLVDPGGARLRHAAAPSLPDELRAALDDLAVAPLGAASGAAAWRAETVACADIATDPLWEGRRALALKHGVRSARSIPILSPSGAVLGTFTWYYRELREPGAHEAEAMALLANTASLVLGERHEAQQRKAAEDRSHAILESMSEGFLALGPDWRITYANSAAEQVTRMSGEELVGGQFWDLFPHVRGTEREQGFRRTAIERVRTRIEAFLDAHGRWFEINSFPTPGGGIALYFRDETERRRAEERIRRLAAVAEQSSDFIGIFTPDAGGLYLNPAGRAMAGLAPDADIGAWRIIDFIAEECRALARDQVLPALAGAPAQWEGELHFARPRGPVIPVYFKGFAVRDAQGANIGLAIITRDITRQKRAEDELRRIAADLSEADHRKSEFLATLAHELRNPLAPIRTGLDLLRIAPGDAASVARVYDMMDRQLGHLIHLVDDLLDVARITRGKIELKKEKLDLRAIVATALETSAALIEGSGHILKVDVPDEPLELEADATRLVQVLSNLLNNAAKYTPEGGQVSLKVWREDGQVVVAVSDTGVGIPPESMGSVFEMFTQVRSSLDRAQGGLGIGLSLVRRLVELHGGRASAASAGRGKGSTFTVRLPLQPVAHGGGVDGQADEGGGARAPRQLRVLVVDDNTDAADSLVALLELLGHNVRVANDGPQGFRLARAFAPDLVFLDIGLPGMNGHEVARAIRATPALRNAMLIALTGWGAASDMTQSQDAGFDQHLTKPVSFEALEQSITAAAQARR